MQPHISLLAVILAALSSFLVGSVWYSPSLFLNPWKRMVAADDAHMKRTFARAMAYIGIASLVTAYALAHFTLFTMQVTGASQLVAALQTAFWLWLGIAVTTTISSGALDTRDPMLMAIQGGNRFATLLLMALIIGLVH